ncbi:MAG: hypothetical protein K9I34_04540 [Bacteroidales bacterium]|nr:hypothetical protein [Bacteroidales bacterium]
MSGDIKSMLVHLVIILIVSCLLLRYHAKINRFVTKSYKDIQKGIDKKQQQRYARMVNREEAKLFGKDKSSMGGKSGKGSNISSHRKTRKSSRSNTHG